MGLEGVSPFSSLFCAFLRFFCGNLPFSALFALEKGEITAIYWKNGEFHSDPVCTDPVENFPSKVFLRPPSGHGRPRLRVRDVRAKNFIFLRSERWGERLFGPGRPPGCPRGRPQDIRLYV